MNSAEKREHERRRVFAAVGIGAESGPERVGVTRDVSSGGMLFHSASRFLLGQQLSLSYRSPQNCREIPVTGRVVRVADMPDTEFPHLTAIVFDEPAKNLA